MGIGSRRIDPVEQAAEETFAFLWLWLILFDVLTHNVSPT